MLMFSSMMRLQLQLQQEEISQSLHPASAMGVIVLTSCVSVWVCLSVRLTLLAKRTDIRTWILAYRSSGRISRSSSKVKLIGQRSWSPGQKTFSRVAYSGSSLTDAKVQVVTGEMSSSPHDAARGEEVIIYSTPYMNGRATTRGVFKAYVVFFSSNIAYHACYNIFVSMLAPQPCWPNDLDLWPMTFIFELDLDILRQDLHTKCKVCTLVFSDKRARRKHTHRRTDNVKTITPSANVGCNKIVQTELILGPKFKVKFSLIVKPMTSLPRSLFSGLR